MSLSGRRSDRPRPTQGQHRQIAGANLGRVARPNSGNLRLAVRTTPRAGDAVGLYQIPGPLDQRFLAARATCVLPGADLTGTIAGIDETQPFFHADLERAIQVL